MSGGEHCVLREACRTKNGKSNKEEIDETFILKENTKILEKIKGELKDK